MKILYLLLACFLLLTACKKDPTSGPTSAEGRVLDGVTQQPVANADVHLFRQQAGSYQYHQVQTVFTGADGRYSLSFGAADGYSYYLAATTDAYRQSSYQSISSGRKNVKDLFIEPKGWLRLTFVNAPPMDTVDAIIVNGSYQPKYHVSDTVNIMREGWGGRMTPVSYFITRNGIETNYQEEFYCAAHDTTMHYIYY